MKDIYLPNLLRIENYKTGNSTIDSTIPYFMEFNLDDNKEFQTLISYQISNILFDRICLDLLELPVFIKELASLDIEAAKYILNKGLISYIDIKDIRISTMTECRNSFDNYTTTKNKYTLVAYGRLNVLPATLIDFENYIHSFIKDDDFFNKLKPSLKKYLILVKN